MESYEARLIPHHLSFKGTIVDELGLQLDTYDIMVEPITHVTVEVPKGAAEWSHELVPYRVHGTQEFYLTRADLNKLLKAQAERRAKGVESKVAARFVNVKLSYSENNYEFNPRGVWPLNRIDLSKTPKQILVERINYVSTVTWMASG
ncbi:hypothetical protein SPFM15_00198 [Salmonella phage SPFM15]|nr:hypothetical protein SPFM5_00193 [Salmonella phage SPFM5]VFR13822.1 hypothetical protein SPFM15_00198 [Salmonella phage SPFM15]